MSIHKDKARGTWYVRYRIGNDQHSKRGFATKREAETYEADQLRAANTSTWTDPKRARLTVGELFEDWISAANIQDRTRNDYRVTWRNQIAPKWEKQPLKAVTPAGVQRWTSDLARTYSRSTINQAVTIVNQMMRFAVADQRIPANPVDRARALNGRSLVPRGGVSKGKRFLTHDEIATLAANAGESSLLVLFMAYTGVRFGEVSAIQARDIDLLRNRVLLRRAFADVNGKLQDVTPKSGFGREIPIPELLRAPLRERIESLGPGPDGLLFPSPEGQPLRYNNWRNRVFDKAAKAAGLTGVTPHALRHSYASLAIQAGANVKTIQQALGHADIRLTLDTYGHLYPSDLDTLGDALNVAAADAASAVNVPKMFPRAAVIAAAEAVY